MSYWKHYTINSKNHKTRVTCLTQSSHLGHTCTRQTPHWQCNVQVLGSNCKDPATGGGHDCCNWPFSTFNACINLSKHSTPCKKRRNTFPASFTQQQLHWGLEGMGTWWWTSQNFPRHTCSSSRLCLLLLSRLARRCSSLGAGVSSSVQSRRNRRPGSFRLRLQLTTIRIISDFS